MKAMACISTMMVLLVPAALQGAVHHTAAQAAYFDAHAKCVKQLRDAKKAAASKDSAERKGVVDAAKQEYRRCEAHAHLIWKFYPDLPPQDSAPAATTTAGSPKPSGTPPHR
jgi:hypothetical protein